MTSLDGFAALSGEVQGLAIVSTLRADGTIQTSLVNAGVLAHPVSGEPVSAFVTYGPVKLANLRRRPQLTLTVRSNWRWQAVEGRAQLAGPDDPVDGIDEERLRLLLREIFTSAGGSHDDWPVYDRAMIDQRRAAVLITPTRAYGN